MGIADIREQLHKYINVANDNDIAAIYSYIEAKSIQPHKYSEEELNEFYRRKEKYMSGESKGYSVEEVHDYIRQMKIDL